MIKVTIEPDSDCENPVNDDSTWTLISFNRNHVGYESPDNYLEAKYDSSRSGTNVKERTSIEPANITIRNKMKAGTAFKLDYFEHGNSVWSLHGEGPQCQFDTSRHAGMLLWNNPVKDMGYKTYEDRQKDARNFLKYYTSWCNGETYWYKIEKMVDGEWEEIDSCGGFIGVDTIKEAITDAVRIYKNIEYNDLAQWIMKDTIV